MLTLLIIFAVSGVGIVVLLELKLYQLKTGRFILWHSKRSKVEEKTRVVAGGFGDKILRTCSAFSVNTIRQMPKAVVSRSRAALSRVEGFVDRKSNNLVSAVRGRRELAQRGKPSDFLTNISKASADRIHPLSQKEKTQ